MCELCIVLVSIQLDLGIFEVLFDLCHLYLQLSELLLLLLLLQLLLLLCLLAGLRLLPIRIEEILLRCGDLGR